MRFRARITRERLPTLWQFVRELDMVAREVVVLLRHEELLLTAVAPGERMMQFCSVPAGRQLFEDFRVESRADNTIVLLVQVENLVQALKAAVQCAESVTLKLTKRGASPFLMLEIKEPGGGSAGGGGGGGGAGGGTTTQDVPVKMLTADDARRYSNPWIPKADAQLMLPHALSVLAVLERMRAVAKHVRVRIDSAAGGASSTLELEVGNESVSMRTHVPGNTPLGRAGAGAGVPPLSQAAAGHCEVLVSAKDLCRVLKAATALDPAAAPWVLSLERSALVLHSFLADQSGTITYLVSPVDAGVSCGGD